MAFMAKLQEAFKGEEAPSLTMIGEVLASALAYRNPHAARAARAQAVRLQALEESLEQVERNVAAVIKREIPRLEKTIADVDAKVLEASKDFLNRDGLRELADKKGLTYAKNASAATLRKLIEEADGKE